MPDQEINAGGACADAGLFLATAVQKYRAGDYHGAYEEIRAILARDPRNGLALDLQEQIMQAYAAALYQDNPGGIVIRTGHFAVNPPDAGAIFKAAVTSIDLETSSYCNRRCLFCPVAATDRHTAARQQQIMGMPLFHGIVADLQAIGYAGRIVLTRFNEPLADPLLLERIGYLRPRLPKAMITVITNGDLLTRDYLAELDRAGCDMLRISFHLQEAPVYAHDTVRYQEDV